MKEINKLTLDRALSHIKQLCESKSRPFFFIIGAGVSSPPIKLSWEIEEYCKKEARKRGREDEPHSSRPIDTYSHWFENAYPNSIERQEFLRKLIEKSYVSHANFRLAHILINQAIANLVITPNFDDFLSRALGLFGVKHIVYDHPGTFSRIDSERRDIQIVHVHGSYMFYDCINLTEEIVKQAEEADGKPSKIALMIEDLLKRRSPIVVGYSGWEGDVIMTGLRLGLSRGLPSNLYWFCYKESDIDSLPSWLKGHENVHFILPPTIPSEKVIKGEATLRLYRGKASTPSLTAREVFDRFIQYFHIEAPSLTRDPLGFFTRHLSSLFPKDDKAKEEDIYSFGEIIKTLQRLKAYEDKEIAKRIASQLEGIRNYLRESDYRGVIQIAREVDIDLLSNNYRKEIIKALWSSAMEIHSDSEQQLEAYNQILRIGKRIKNQSLNEASTITILKSYVGKGILVGEEGQNESAIELFNETISRIRKDNTKELRELLAMALLNKGVMLSDIGKKTEAITVFNKVIKRFGSVRDIELKRGLVRAYYNKGILLTGLEKNKDAIASYDKAIKLYGRINDNDIKEILGSALINKAILHGNLGHKNKETESYNRIFSLLINNDELFASILKAKALVNKSVAFLRSKRIDESIAVSEELLEAYERSEFLDLHRYVCKAFINKADALVEKKEKEKAIRIYNKIRRRYSHIEDSEFEQAVAMALIRKGNQYINVQQASNAYDRVISDYGKSKNEGMQEQVATALFNKATKWLEAEEYEDAIKIYNDVQKRFKSSTTTTLQRLYAIASLNKAGTYLKLKQTKKALGIYNNLLDYLLERGQSNHEESIARTLYGKLLALCKAKKWAQEEVIYSQLKELFETSKDDKIKSLALESTLLHCESLVEQGRGKDALLIINQLITRTRRSKEAETLKSLPRILNVKGFILGRLLKHKEAISIYRSVLRVAKKFSALDTREEMALASNGIGYQTMCLAKKLLQNGRDVEASKKLLRAREELDSALKKSSYSSASYPFILGNLAYAHFLSGETGAALSRLEKALHAGGEKLRKGELDDTKIYTLPRDKQFRALIRSIKV